MERKRKKKVRVKPEGRPVEDSKRAAMEGRFLEDSSASANQAAEDTNV